MKSFAAAPRGHPLQRLGFGLRLLAVGLVVACCAGCALPSRVLLADADSREPAGASARMFDRVDELVRTRHYSRTLHGVDWPDLCQGYRPLVAAATSEGEAYRIVNEMLRELRDSHTFARAPGRSRRGGGDRATEDFEPDLAGDTAVQELPGGVVYLRFDHFNGATIRWLRREIAAHRHARSIIVDLRHNWGGLIVSAQQAVGLFFEKSVPMGVVVHRDGRRTTERSRGTFGPRYLGPLAVLVGPDSYSSAEVFSYVMQTQSRAVVVGNTTAGEVLGSRRYRLPDGGRLQLSISDYRCFDGQQLEGRGVRPDVFVGDARLDVGSAAIGDPGIAAALQALSAL